MSPFTGPVFATTHPVLGIRWRRRHYLGWASESITDAQAEHYFGSAAFARVKLPAPARARRTA